MKSIRLYLTTSLISFTYLLLTSIVLLAENSNVCLDCHDDYAGSLSSTSHSDANKTLDITCTSCHVNYTDHLEEPDIENITNPDRLKPYEALDICSSCHFDRSESDFAHAGSHLKAGVNCSGCHKIHNNSAFGYSALAKKDINETCLDCHDHQNNVFSMLSSHPVKAGVITCIDCHDYFGNLVKTFTTFDKNSTCYKCHTEMDGPFLYEHEAARDFGLEDGGCLNCHDPHGSAFLYLLDEPVQQLCQQCHVVSAGHSAAHNSTSCLECHVDIHGSDADDHFLVSRPTNIISNPPCNECHQ